VRLLQAYIFNRYISSRRASCRRVSG
jgi:hypothetical protein